MRKNLNQTKKGNALKIILSNFHMPLMKLFQFTKFFNEIKKTFQT
jgi:hypothetical protein